MEGLTLDQQVRPQFPPGFTFDPTDEELLIHYLKKKVSCSPFPASIIAEIDPYKHDPWDLPAKACFGEKEWYFFSPRDRKYPSGALPNRLAGSGYWKATGTDKSIAISSSQKLGVKKSLVFYKGRSLEGVKTKWNMQEYRLPETKPTKRKASMSLDDWVLCRIYEKVSHSSVLVSQRTQQESALPKFRSFSTMLQREGPFMERILSHANNAAVSSVESSSSLLLPQLLNSSESGSNGSMSMALNGDEVSSVSPPK